MLNLDSAKAIQDKNIPTKVINENGDRFAGFLFSSFNNSLTNPKFLSTLKQ